jgi:beta-glucosidase-like glycosyl hydrolase
MNVIGRLAVAIGYPLVVPADRLDFTFKVDDGEVRALDLDKRIVLTRVISREIEDLPRLAAYSAGRMLRESATLYWDERGGAVMLAQEISATAVPHEMKYTGRAAARAAGGGTDDYIFSSI